MRMKKRSIVFISILLLFVTVLPFILGACSGLGFTLKKPTLSYDSGVVSWSDISMASGYIVTVYADNDGVMGEKIGEGIVVQSTSYALSQDGIYWIGVYAVATGKFLKSSEEAYIRVEKKNTQEDVTVPGGEGSGGDPVNPSGEDVIPSGVPDMNLPVGATRKFNYISALSYGGISVALTANTDKVVSLYSVNKKITSGWSYDALNNAVVLDYALFSGVQEGTDTKFTAVTQNGDTFDFYVTLCAVTDIPAEIDVPSYGAYVFCKNSSEASEGLTVNYGSAASTLAVSMDGKRLSNSTTNYSASINQIRFKENYLKNLGYGLHRAEIFTTKGILDFYLFVYSSSIMCYNLAYEFDDNYPQLKLTWDVDYPVDRYEVVVNGIVYSSEETPERFNGNSFDLQGIVDIGASCSACVKSYVNDVETPATSSTVAFVNGFEGLTTYLDKSEGFTYLGKTYNRYIDSEEEMDILAFYMILYNYELDTKSFNTSSGSKTMSYMDVYLDPVMGVRDASEAMELFYESCTKYKESIKYDYAVVKLSDGAYRIGLSMTSKNEALYDSETSYTESSSNVFHLSRSSRADDFEDFKINEREGIEVKTSDQLFFAIEAGYRPLPVAGSVAEKLYNLAKDVCRTYIDDSMTDYEKVHAIYDWLGKNVIYDYNIVNEMDGIKPESSLYNKFYSYDCFYLEGVLENGVAVCNGIAKTFVVLCGIEGITALKVNGIASGGAHAWNKVLINEKWYIVDSTWSNRRSTGNKEVFTHEYLFLTTSESASDRTEQTEDTIDYYCGDRHIKDLY